MNRKLMKFGRWYVPVCFLVLAWMFATQSKINVGISYALAVFHLIFAIASAYAYHLYFKDKE